MARFLTTRGTTSEIEKIINDARKSLVLITPYVKIPDSLFQNLIAADKRGVKTTVIQRKSELERGVKEQLRQLSHVRVYVLGNLHAKCYFNEQCMVITSFNLFDPSEQNNREMGVLATKQEDEEVFKEAVREAEMMLDVAEPCDLCQTISTKPSSRAVQRSETTQKETKEGLGTTLLRGFADILFDKVGLGQGYCIGCRARIGFDEYRPYCPDCYKLWSNNRAQKGSYCHECGKAVKTTINKPLCRPCFEKSLD